MKIHITEQLLDAVITRNLCVKARQGSFITKKRNVSVFRAPGGEAALRHFTSVLHSGPGKPSSGRAIPTETLRGGALFLGTMFI